jgi:hypothetical protein
MNLKSLIHRELCEGITVGIPLGTLAGILSGKDPKDLVIWNNFKGPSSGSELTNRRSNARSQTRFFTNKTECPLVRNIIRQEVAIYSCRLDMPACKHDLSKRAVICSSPVPNHFLTKKRTYIFLPSRVNRVLSIGFLRCERQ